jgi:hypothetical protein
VSKVGSDINEKYGDDLNHQVNKVGQHLKSTANLATDAAQTAYKDLKESTKDDVEAVVDSLKEETAKITHELKAETDRFRAQHHLKEGDRPAEDIVAHAHNSDIYEAARISVTGKKLDANEAAFDAASKLGSELKQKASDAAHHLSKETGKFKSSITNPMVDEKRSAGRTKTLEELRLEDKAKNVVHDTSVLVDHDSQKVKDVWRSKEEGNEFTYGSNLKTADASNRKTADSLSSSWEDLKEDAKDAWNETKDQAAAEADRLKKGVAASYQDLKGDAQDAFRKETSTAKEAWEDVKDQVSSKTDHLSKKATASYNDLKHDAQDAFRNETLTAKEAWKDTKDQVASNINHLNKKATASYDDLKHDAQDAFRSETLTAKEAWNDQNTPSLSKKASYTDLKHDAQDAFRKETLTAKEAWEDTKQQATSEAGRLKRQAADALDDATNKTKKQAKSSWTNLKENVKEDAENLLNKAEDVAGRYKQEASKASAEWDKTQRNAQAKAESWFEQDNWAEKKVDEAKNWVQESVEELKGDLKNAQEKISETFSEGLKGTRQNLRNLKPAEVIVEDARYHNI